MAAPGRRAWLGVAALAFMALLLPARAGVAAGIGVGVGMRDSVGMGVGIGVARGSGVAVCSSPPLHETAITASANRSA